MTDLPENKSKIPSAPVPIRFDLGRAIAWLISKPLWFITFEGIDNIPPPDSGPLVVASNHQTYIDPVWVCIPLRRSFRFIAVDQAFAWPIVGPLIRFLGAFAVKHPVDASPRAFKESIRALRNGNTLIIFPEGARESADGGPLAFKTGAVKIALRAGVPILPVTISGANRVWPPGQKRPRIFRRITVIYHLVLRPDESKSPEQWTADIRSSITGE